MSHSTYTWARKNKIFEFESDQTPLDPNDQAVGKSGIQGLEGDPLNTAPRSGTWPGRVWGTAYRTRFPQQINCDQEKKKGGGSAQRQEETGDTAKFTQPCLSDPRLDDTKCENALTRESEH